MTTSLSSTNRLLLEEPLFNYQNFSHTRSLICDGVVKEATKKNNYFDKTFSKRPRTFYDLGFTEFVTSGDFPFGFFSNEEASDIKSCLFKLRQLNLATKQVFSNYYQKPLGSKGTNSKIKLAKCWEDYKTASTDHFDLENAAETLIIYKHFITKVELRLSEQPVKVKITDNKIEEVVILRSLFNKIEEYKKLKESKKTAWALKLYNAAKNDENYYYYNPYSYKHLRLSLTFIIAVRLLINPPKFVIHSDGLLLRKDLKKDILYMCERTKNLIDRSESY